MTTLPVWRDIETVKGYRTVRLEEPFTDSTGWTLKMHPWGALAVDLIGSFLPDGGTTITARRNRETIMHASVGNDHLWAVATGPSDEARAAIIGCKVFVPASENPEPLMLAAVDALARILAALELLREEDDEL